MKFTFKVAYKNGLSLGENLKLYRVMVHVYSVVFPKLQIQDIKKYTRVIPVFKLFD